MASASTPSIIRVPGRLIWNPTDLGRAEPYGGTYLGTVREIEFTPNVAYYDVTDEALGAVTDSIYLGQQPCQLKGTVRYPDEDMLLTAAPDADSSGSQGVHWFFNPSSGLRPGTSLYNTMVGKLLFAPKAADDHPMIIIYKAMPMISPAAAMRFSRSKEWGLEVIFRGSLDSSGRVYDQGRRGAIVL